MIGSHHAKSIDSVDITGGILPIHCGLFQHGSTELKRSGCLHPCLIGRIPYSSDWRFRLNDIKIAIIVQVQESVWIFPTLFVSQWGSKQQILIQPLGNLGEGQEFHLFPILLHSVINQLDHLIISNPSVRVENEVHHALFDHRQIQRHLHIFNGQRIVGLMQTLSLPITWHHAGEFPANPINHIGVGIISNRIGERGEGDVLVESESPILISK